jgi:hypothetical protein
LQTSRLQISGLAAWTRYPGPFLVLHSPASLVSSQVHPNSPSSKQQKVSEEELAPDVGVEEGVEAGLEEGSEVGVEAWEEGGLLQTTFLQAVISGALTIYPGPFFP